MKSEITGLARTVKVAAPFEFFPKEKIYNIGDFFRRCFEGSC